MKETEERLPSHWASALANDDWSGYDDEEITQIRELLQFSGLDKYFCSNVADDSSFQQCPSYWSPSYGLLPDDYSTFTFTLR